MSGTTKWRAPQWPTQATNLSLNQPTLVRKASLPSNLTPITILQLDSKKQDLLTLEGTPRLLAKPALSMLPLLMLYKTRSCPKSLGKSTYSWGTVLPQYLDYYFVTSSLLLNYIIIFFLSFDSWDCHFPEFEGWK